MAGLFSLIVLVILALLFDILTGALSAPSIVATMVASRAMGARKAIIMSTLTELIGPFLFGLAVANAIGSEVINIQLVTLPIMYAALLSASLWMLACWYLNIPSSASHAQIGGMIGAGVMALGAQALQVSGILKILVALTLTAPISFIASFIIVRVCYFLAHASTPDITRRFNQGQWIASAGLGLTIGSNAAQRTMGMIAIGLVLTGYVQHFTVPLWVVAISAVGLAFGNLLGIRLIHTVGAKFFKIRAIHGFSAELASTVVILTTSLLGGPVSTSQLTNMAIIGAGTAERMSMVRWHFVRQVLIAWVLTIPMAAALGGLFYLILHGIGVR